MKRFIRMAGGMNYMASYKQIAKLTGLSFGTISNVINGKGTVKAENVEKVNMAIKQLEYRPNYQAKALASDKTWLLGVIVPSINDVRETEIFSYMEEFARSRGYRIMLATSQNSAKEEINQCENMLSCQVDCLFIMPYSSENKGYFQHLSEQMKDRIIFINRYLEDVDIPFTVVDNDYAAEEIIRHVYEKGHRSAAFLDFKDREISSTRDRRKGIIKWSARMGIECNIVDIESTEEDEVAAGYRYAEKAIKNEGLPQLILARDDAMAIGIYSACVDHGVRVPEDVSIVGFGKYYSDYMTPKKLTTFNRDFKSLLKRATDMFLAITNGETENMERRIFIKGYMEKRDTVSKV